MKSIEKRIISVGCAVAMAVNCVAGVMAQDRKGEAKPNGVQTEPRPVVATTILGSDPANVIFRAPDGSITAHSFYPGQQGGDNAFQFFSREMSFDNRLVKGAPFSADIVSETVQTLTDGNRIVQRSEGRIYRDSQGRTRNERAFQIGGQIGGSTDQKQTISIFDPVANVNSMLDPEARTARKAPFFFSQTGGGAMSAGSGGGVGLQGVMTLINPDNSAEPRKISMSDGVLQGGAIKKVQPSYPPIAKAAGAEGPVQVQVVISETGAVSEASVVSGHPLLREAALEAARQWLFKPTEVSAKPVKVQGILTFNFTMEKRENSAPVDAARRVAKYATNTEQLGKQMIEGVECEGMRAITTMPASAIGNERPIETVTESWYSSDLKMVVLTKRNDPRFGESTYRVTNISRAEPDASLFQVPSDYTIKEGGFGFVPASRVEVKSVEEKEILKKARKPDNQ